MWAFLWLSLTPVILVGKVRDTVTVIIPEGFQEDLQGFLHIIGIAMTAEDILLAEAATFGFRQEAVGQVKIMVALIEPRFVFRGRMSGADTFIGVKVNRCQNCMN